jgi:hypothetical protein
MVAEKTLTKVDNDNGDYLGLKSISAKSVRSNDGVQAYTNVELICRRVLNTIFQQLLPKMTQNDPLGLDKVQTYALSTGATYVFFSLHSNR